MGSSSLAHMNDPNIEELAGGLSVILVNRRPITFDQSE
jgi:hypothetical protein